MVQVTALPGREHDARFAPSGNAVWFVHSEHGQSHIYRVGFDTSTGLPRGTPEQITHQDNRQIGELAWVDGTNLVYRVTHTDSRIWVAERSSSWTAREVAAGYEPMLARNGRTLYFLSREWDRQGLFALDLTEPHPPVQLAPNLIEAAGFGAHPRFDAYGERVIYCADDGGAFAVFDVARQGGAPRRRITSTTRAVEPQFSPDGSRIAFVDDETLCVVDPNTGARRELAREVWRWESSTLRWSPRGDALAAVVYTSPTQLQHHANSIVRIELESGEVQSLTASQPTTYMEGVEWHPSGDFLSCVAYTERGERLWKVWADGRGIAPLWDQPDGCPCPYVGTWSPDGHRFAFECNSGCGEPMHVYDFETRRGGSKPVFRGLPRWDGGGDVVCWTQTPVLRHFERLHDAR